MAAIIPIPAFSDNYIWLLSEGRRAVVVDPGDAAPVLRRLSDERLTLSAILVTHHHRDHVGGVQELVAHAHVPVYGPAGEAIPARTHALSENDRVTLDALGMTFRVLDVPGHTAGHIAYVCDAPAEGGPMAFVGDTLFAAGCGRLFEGTAEQMARSLDKLATLPDETRVYCAHEYTLANLRFGLAVEPGNPALHERIVREQAKRSLGQPTVPSRMAEERATNPFLRTREQAVIAAAERHAGSPMRDAVATFAALRAWKNAF